MTGVYRIYPKKRKFILGSSLTTKLIILNLLIYVISLFVLSSYGEEFFIKNLALTPALIISGKSIWTFLTSMFMHGSFFHIFANMFSLFFLGNFLEKIIGKRRFFWVYFISGIVGGGFYILATLIFGGLDIPAVGASGAIFGLLGMLAVLVPYSRIYLIIGPLLVIVGQIIITQFLPINLIPGFNLIANILIFVMIFSLFSFNKSMRKIAVPLELPMWLLPIIAIIPLSIISFFVNLPIGNSAHFGGLVVGLVYGFYLKSKFPNKVRKISDHFR
jgi:membrane associated rhomboid family serine protease